MILSLGKKFKIKNEYIQILFWVCVILIYNVLIYYILVLLNIKDTTDNMLNKSSYFLFIIDLFMATIAAGFSETLIYQLMPFLLINKILKKRKKDREFNYIYILFSSSFFALAHLGYSLVYALYAFPIGVLFAKLIILEKKESGSLEKSFWFIVKIHASYNLVAVLLISFT
ncbi:CPBP family glutamic-type intramembrane protease [Helicovermis profundi]|uniref:CAAX prenyl protease 2/Lysostaphin resistance protein A-like domain-containing protein n=1 Tax=Helicovermis profundi TaxID=3065157 RepID=A0AAU9E4H5_9FIRM|nr:hypothetical protein HLPR_16490 [Clostridia bacterium S502]